MIFSQGLVVLSDTCAVMKVRLVGSMPRWRCRPSLRLMTLTPVRASRGGPLVRVGPSPRTKKLSQTPLGPGGDFAGGVEWMMMG